MALSQMKMFFARLGGRDIPLAYNWYDKFGYNSAYDAESKEYKYGDGDPIYKHSLMDVMNNFDKPITFNVTDKLGTLKSVSDVCIAETKNNDDVKNIIPSSTFWTKVFKLLETIYESQATWRGAPRGTPTDGTPYSCYGDEELRSGKTEYSDISSVYVPGSLTVNISSSTILDTRILSCELKVTNANLSTDERSQDQDTIANIVNLTVYFNPDTYIIQGASRNYAVYSYEDLSDPQDDKIDDSEMRIYTNGNTNVAKTEFQAGIIDKITEILKGGKYKRVIRFCPNGGTSGTTFFINKGEYGVTPDGSKSVLYTDKTKTEIITEENYSEYGYNKPFYIFTSLDENEPLDDSTLLGYVKNYVNTVLFDDVISNTNQLVERNLRFPNMFVDTVVSIYPILTNYEGTGASSSNLKSPIGGKLLSDFLAKIPINDTNYEIFYLGKAVHGAGSSNLTEIPLIAREHDVSSVTANSPISSRFPAFRPITSANDSNTDMDSDTIILHDLLVCALSVLLGVSDIDEVQSINTITIGGVQYDFITGLTNFKEIEAGQSQNSAAKIKHTVEFTFKNIKYEVIDNEYVPMGE